MSLELEIEAVQVPDPFKGPKSLILWRHFTRFCCLSQNGCVSVAITGSGRAVAEPSDWIVVTSASTPHGLDRVVSVVTNEVFWAFFKGKPCTTAV